MTSAQVLARACVLPHMHTATISLLLPGRGSVTHYACCESVQGERVAGPVMLLASPIAHADGYAALRARAPDLFSAECVCALLRRDAADF